MINILNIKKYHNNKENLWLHFSPPKTTEILQNFYRTRLSCRTPYNKYFVHKNVNRYNILAPRLLHLRNSRSFCNNY